MKVLAAMLGAAQRLLAGPYIIGAIALLLGLYATNPAIVIVGAILMVASISFAAVIEVCE